MLRLLYSQRFLLLFFIAVCVLLFGILIYLQTIIPANSLRCITRFTNTFCSDADGYLIGITPLSGTFIPSQATSMANAVRTDVFCNKRVTGIVSNGSEPRFIVDSSEAYLRKAPLPNGDINATVQCGDQFKVAGYYVDSNQVRWYSIENEQGKALWIEANAGRLIGNNTNLPQINPTLSQ